MLIGNHRSSVDPILEMGVLRKYNIGFVAKQELFKIPVIGKIMHKCFCLSLNRNNPREDVKAIVGAAKLIKNQTAAIGIYPEGKRNKGKGLSTFKKTDVHIDFIGILDDSYIADNSTITIGVKVKNMIENYTNKGGIYNFR